MSEIEGGALSGDVATWESVWNAFSESEWESSLLELNQMVHGLDAFIIEGESLRQKKLFSDTAEIKHWMSLNHFSLINDAGIALFSFKAFLKEQPSHREIERLIAPYAYHATLIQIPSLSHNKDYLASPAGVLRVKSPFSFVSGTLTLFQLVKSIGARKNSMGSSTPFATSTISNLIVRLSG